MFGATTAPNPPAPEPTAHPPDRPPHDAPASATFAMPALGVCLSLVAALGAAPSGPSTFVPTTAFTLAWTHSIEKVRWEEDYRVEIDPATAQPRLHATAARIKGSGAGMEPPPDAVLRNGWYHYTPAIRYPPELHLTRSEFTADYDWCMRGQCQPMSNLIAASAYITRASACFYQ